MIKHDLLFCIRLYRIRILRLRLCLIPQKRQIILAGEHLVDSGRRCHRLVNDNEHPGNGHHGVQNDREIGHECQYFSHL